MFIYRDDYYHKDSEEKNVAEVIIAKQRNSPIGTIKLVWLPEYTKFASASKNKRIQASKPDMSAARFRTTVNKILVLSGFALYYDVSAMTAFDICMVC